MNFFGLTKTVSWPQLVIFADNSFLKINTIPNTGKALCYTNLVALFLVAQKKHTLCNPFVVFYFRKLNFNLKYSITECRNIFQLFDKIKILNARTRLKNLKL